MNYRFNIIFFLILSFSGFADTDTEKVEKYKFDIGFGIGLDHGGIIGAKLSYLPIPYLSIFISPGYNLINFSGNVGMCLYFLPKTSEFSFRPYILGMYGSNASIKVYDKQEYVKTYYGASFGVGLELRIWDKDSGFNVGLNYGIKTKEFNNDIEYLNKTNDVFMIKGLGNIISIGYHFEF